MNLPAIDGGLHIIRHYEGLRLKPYLCPAGYWTIGYGHVLRHGDGSMMTAADPAPNIEWLPATAETNLQKTASRYAARAAALCPPAAASGAQLGALTSFAYNLGLGALRASTLRRLILAGDDDGATEQFGRWIFAGGRKLPGLILRRADEAKLYAGAHAIHLPAAA